MWLHRHLLWLHPCQYQFLWIHRYLMRLHRYLLQDCVLVSRMNANIIQGIQTAVYQLQKNTGGSPHCKECQKLHCHYRQRRNQQRRKLQKQANEMVKKSMHRSSLSLLPPRNGLWMSLLEAYNNAEKTTRGKRTGNWSVSFWMEEVEFNVEIVINRFLYRQVRRQHKLKMYWCVVRSTKLRIHCTSYPFIYARNAKDQTVRSKKRKADAEAEAEVVSGYNNTN